MQQQQHQFFFEPHAPGFYECTYTKQYRYLPLMDYCDWMRSERQTPTMRPRTPPLPPRSSRSRSRSRSPRRRYRSPGIHHDSYRPRSYRYIESIDPYSRPSMKSRARPQESRCIGIFGLHERTSEDDIRYIFSKYGYIENVVLIMDNKTRRSRGYCFVYFETMKSAIRAVESSANLRIDNRYVRVDFSITSRPRSPGASDRYRDETSRFTDRHRGTRRAHNPRRYHR